MTSIKNPALQLIRSLDSKRTRRERRQVVAEGEDLIEAALDAGLVCEALVIDGDRVDTDDAIVRRTGSVRNRYEISTDLMRRVSAMGHAPRAIGVFAQPPQPAFRTVAMPPQCGVWLAGVGDPGNVGTLIRTAGAFGCDWVALGPGSADSMNPRALRASMGAAFTIPVLDGVSAEDLATRGRLRVVAGVVRGGTPYWDADLVSPFIAALGAEREGIETALAGAENDLEIIRVTIPQEPDTESLNVAAAGAVILAEARRQRAHFLPR